jgi:hypothetical protein
VRDPGSSTASPRARGRRGTTDEQAVEARIADVGRRIDEIAWRAHGVRDDTRVRVEQRVNDLRARETEMRSSARAASESGVLRDASVELDREIDEIDIEIVIADTQLDLDSADDPAAFEAAAGRQIDAYRAYVELLQSPMRRGNVSVLGQPAFVEAVRDRTAAAAAALHRYRELSHGVAGSLRAGVLSALDDLERAAARERSKSGNSERGE